MSGASSTLRTGACRRNLTFTSVPGLGSVSQESDLSWVAMAQVDSESGGRPLIFRVCVVMVAMLIASALPAAAQGFGPSIFCDGGTFNGCTDGFRLDSSRASFTCEAAARDVASCTNERTAETFPYCVLLGHEPNEDRDVYLCGPKPESQ